MSPPIVMGADTSPAGPEAVTAAVRRARLRGPTAVPAPYHAHRPVAAVRDSDARP
ncbi:hypothetical protein JS756_21325 [Streptomyces actuosus]|uniref:Universal stress protein n=1 Tax=Streptomyces actuosus TaxID=1885 RepID=A0ABS2VTZ2_STRAS|nr:hypothetical protein [Streptomyces actuosus]MBN0046599.1 hypothetical protein [Streptomyces actuosus]